MTDIITDPVTVTKQVKTRARQIYIDNPAGADKRLDFTSEGVVLLDGTPAGSESRPAVTRMMSAIQTETVDITDPVTGQPLTISAAGIATAIEELYCRWYNQDRAG